jgi:nucleoid-associated protein YgaU
MIYQAQSDSLSALYHFNRYLAARPDSEKAVVIRQVVEDEFRRIAPEASADLPADITALQSQLRETRSRLADAEQRLAETEIHLQQARLRAQGNLEPPADWAREKLELLRQLQSLRQAAGESAGPARPAATPSPAAPPAATVRNYTVKPGDTLGSIARTFYGSASDYSRIYQANRDKIPNQNRLKVGTELVIPE